MACIMCHNIIIAVNDNKDDRLFPATHAVPKVLIVIIYYFLLQSKLYIPSTKEKKNKSIPFYAPFGLGQMVCIMCHSIIRAVNDDNEGRSFPAMHTVPKIQTVIKYYFIFVTVKVICPKYYKYF